MTTRTELAINERTSAPVTCTLKDEASVVIPLADIDSIEMTLIETNTGNTVNSRAKQNVLNTNNCTMHETSGLFTWNVQPEDTTVSVVAIGQTERHLATFTVVWDTTKQMHFEIVLLIENLRSVPQVSA